MEYFGSLTQKDLAHLIRSTKKELLIALPMFHQEIAEAIMSVATVESDEKIEIHILVDFDAKTFRQGYGDINSIEQLFKQDIDIKTLKDNRISFVISDQTGYFLFIESRSLIPADKETINAVRIDPVSIVRLKQFFFGTSIKMNYKDELVNAIIDEGLLLDRAKETENHQIAPIAKISKDELKEVSEDLKVNPPLNPDFKRIVEYYSNKFQYVKLKFNGSNIQHRKIEIPSNVLPLADAELRRRLETRLNLFDPDFISDAFSSVQNLKDEVIKIRENYLTKVKSREESLLDKNRKTDFKEAIKELKIKVDTVKTQNLTKITKLINSTQEKLITDLGSYIAENPKAFFLNDSNLWQNSEDDIKYLAMDKARKIVNRISWPDAQKLLGELSIDLQYSDITYEDLKNKKFIGELLECKLINTADEKQLANFGTGVEIKKNRLV